MQETNHQVSGRYTDEYKRQIVTRALQGEAALTLSKETGVPQTTISRWVRAYGGQMGGNRQEVYKTDLNETHRKLEAAESRLTAALEYIEELEKYSGRLELRMFRHYMQEMGIAAPSKPKELLF